LGLRFVHQCEGFGGGRGLILLGPDSIRVIIDYDFAALPVQSVNEAFDLDQFRCAQLRQCGTDFVHGTHGVNSAIGCLLAQEPFSRHVRLATFNPPPTLHLPPCQPFGSAAEVIDGSFQFLDSYPPLHLVRLYRSVRLPL